MMRIRHVLLSVTLLLIPMCASAQELEPGAYWPLPRGMNIVSAINNFNWGDVSFEPSLPIDEAEARINGSVFVFTRFFSLAGRTANASVQVPVVAGHVDGLVLGQTAEADRFGLADPRLKLAMNLYGAPSMTPQEFAAYRMRTIVGVSLMVAPPLGQYDGVKAINLGTNRWSFKPELGLARAFGPWVVEVMAGAWLFTDNTDFFGGRTREQDPISTLQVHLTYRFDRFTWLAADANYFHGGQTTIGGTENDDSQSTARYGATFSKAFTRHHSIRASVSQRGYATIGGDYTSIAFGYNYSWGH